MKKALFTVLAVFVFILNSCGSTETDKSDIVELQIDHYKTVASGPFPGLFHLTQTGEMIGGEDWEIQYSPITNFDYEWGYRYKILAEKRYYNEREEPLMDAPTYKYVFIEELSKTKVNIDLSFEILLQRVYDNGTSEKFIGGSIESGFSILERKPFHCANLCDELTNEIEPKPNTNLIDLIGTFKHTESGDIQLVALRNKDL